MNKNKVNLSFFKCSGHQKRQDKIKVIAIVLKIIIQSKNTRLKIYQIEISF